LSPLVPAGSEPLSEAGRSDLRHTARRAATVAIPVVGGLGLSFVLTVLLARWLGAAEFGTYTYVMSWVAIFGMVGLFGLDATIVRQIPIYVSGAAWDLTQGLLRWATGVTLLLSLSIATLALLARALLIHDGQLLPSPVWLVVGLLVPLTTLSRVQQSVLRGLNRAAVSQVPDLVLVPLFMIGLIAVAVLSPTAEHALIAQVVAVSLALGVASWLVHRAMQDSAISARPRFQPRRWLMTSSGMFLLGGVSTLNGRIGILLLGAISTPHDVGPYAVALRGSGFISLALNIAVLAMAPTIASAYATGQLGRLQLVARQISRIALIGGLPLAAALLLWGRSFLLLFGPGFEIATTALTILILGEVVNIAAGPVATLLVMTGHERDAVLGLAAGTAMNAGLCLILIPAWGINGAAIGATAGVALWNIVLWQFVRARLAFGITILVGGACRGPRSPDA
jgi:O-antigen/teichoic acid export membrane protein